ncbi:MAG: ABC transporter substrate-binding protein [Alphaproteobacteria bacterium]
MTRSTTGTERKRFFAVIALCVALAALAPRPAAASNGSDTVRSLYDTLLATMQSGPTLGPRGRFARIEPVVRRVFDIDYMTRLAVGPEWTRLNEAQRQQVQQAFQRYITAIYAERFDSYSGERLQVTGERPSTGGTIITSQIIKSNGEPVNLNYLMRNNGGAWQIADIYLDGTISELATRRSEFASILRSSGINGLIQTLNAKADTLSASPGVIGRAS